MSTRSPPSAQFLEFQQQKRGQMRRVSLPTALPYQQQFQQNGNGGRRSPRSRTPNSLSPKLGYLKEISEFDIDPPFISPAASSSSSADNSHCNSPMLLSPCTHRPASARLYRRNNRQSQPPQGGPVGAAQPVGGGVMPLSKESPGRSRKSTRSMGARQSEPFMDNGEPDDGFRWTDVDGFYGRKNSIPLQQLLANDNCWLNGIGLKNGLSNGEKPKSGSPPSQLLEVVDPTNGGGICNGNGGGINIPSDITEDEDEEAHADEQNGLNLWDPVKSAVTEVKKSSSAPMSSPTKRRLMMLSSRLYSLENKQLSQKEEDEDDEEDNSSERSNNVSAEKPKKTELQKVLSSGKVKFMDSVDELELNKSSNAGNEDVRLLRRALKARKRREQKLLAAQQLRHFTIDPRGQQIVDSGVRTIRAKLQPGQQPPLPPPVPRNQKARRATCPEIWLSVVEDEQRPVTQCAVRLFGCNSVGKKCIAKQLASSAEVSPPEDDIVSTESEDLQRPYRTVSFLLNEHEVHMEIIQGSLLPESRKGAAAMGELTIFAVVYSVDHRESFIRAAQILYRLYGDREKDKDHSKDQKNSKQKAAMDRACVPLILIANKSDLQRKRRVSSIEGKMLAKIYKCPFVEMSALLSANVDVLWREVVRKLHKYLEVRERLLQQRQESLGGSDTSGSSPRLMARQPLVGRIVERTRRFAKSCEDWISARIVAI